LKPIDTPGEAAPDGLIVRLVILTVAGQLAMSAGEL
jgi:hypothetical protein